jgi:hypothetical protein
LKSEIKSKIFFENFQAGIQISFPTELGNSGAALIDDHGDFPLHHKPACAWFHISRLLFGQIAHSDFCFLSFL